MNIYVGNLPNTLTEDSIRELFSQHGNVSEVKVITDRVTGEPRGFAFVEMPSRTEALKAIESVNGVEIAERSLIVNEARPKQNNTNRGSARRW
jgi:RNA recognition motif-containing protein